MRGSDGEHMKSTMGSKYLDLVPPVVGSFDSP
jgi:hypothetical protein